MPKFKKKPVEIEAIQWTTNTTMSTLKHFANYLVRMDEERDDCFWVYDRLHDTWVEFEYDDWIIKGVKGEFYPCKPDVFRATYDSIATLRDTLEYTENPDPITYTKSREPW